jgi:carbonic anhydrase
MNASVEYAVGVLGVEEIVVCGHSSCGAMAALADGPPPGPLSTWLRHAEPSAHRLGSATLDGAVPDREGDRLALHNVLQQLEHLREYPLVAAAESAGKLQLTGMYFAVGTAQVYLFDATERTFRPAGSVVLAPGT